MDQFGPWPLLADQHRRRGRDAAARMRSRIGQPAILQLKRSMSATNTASPLPLRSSDIGKLDRLGLRR
ncbi:hypothetical protein XH88_08715 [Bradyrhizobium sp. CCBAU 51627]|nr:hypothetical protein [Bradyrhizobium sp. CCBAU 51627]